MLSFLNKDDNLKLYPILKLFLVKTNLIINLPNLVDKLSIKISQNTKVNYECRSGTIIALKYKSIIKGNDHHFKTKTGFKNACHLIMCHTLNNRKKKMIHIKVTATGTFQVAGIPEVDVDKVIYKFFLLLEKLNKLNDIFTYLVNNEDLNCINKYPNRLEIIIIPILNNYMLNLPSETTKKIFQNSKVQIIQKFIDNKFLSFTLPNNSAITIKKSFVYKEFCHQPVKYIKWNKKYGKSIHYIEYDSYTMILADIQKRNAKCRKYITLRLYSTGTFLISGFDEMLTYKCVEEILSICDQF